MIDSRPSAPSITAAYKSALATRRFSAAHACSRFGKVYLARWWDAAGIHIFKYGAQAGIKVIRSYEPGLDPEDRQHQLNLEPTESDDELPAA